MSFQGASTHTPLGVVSWKWGNGEPKSQGTDSGGQVVGDKTQLCLTLNYSNTHTTQAQKSIPFIRDVSNVCLLFIKRLPHRRFLKL